jgi:hypothetical protein
MRFTTTSTNDKLAGKNHRKIIQKEKHNLWKLHSFLKFRLLWTAYIFKLELWTKLSYIFSILTFPSAATK